MTVEPARTSAWCSPAIRCPKAIATRWCRSARSARVDQDLLEDASRSIENALREQGYRDRARAVRARSRRAASWC